MAKERLNFTANGQRIILGSPPVAATENGAVGLQLLTGGGNIVKLQGTMWDPKDPTAQWVDILLRDPTTGTDVATLTTTGQIGWAEVAALEGLSVLVTGFVGAFSVLAGYKRG